MKYLEQNNDRIYNYALLGFIIISILNIVFKNYNHVSSSVIACLLLVLNVFCLLKHRKNKNMLIINIMVTYFNYSIVLGKYLFGGTNLLNNLYGQLENYRNTMGLGINLLFIFNCIIQLIISCKTIKEKNYSFEIDNSKKKLFLYMFFVLVFSGVFLWQIVFNINYNTAVFEYLNILFIFAFLIYGKERKKRFLLEFLMLLLCAYSFLVGERIGALQLLLVDFLINYLPYIKYKVIILLSVTGIIGLTILGVYGDLLDSNNLNLFNAQFIYEQFSERRFASDTAISSYFPTMACLEGAEGYKVIERVKNGIEYFVIYTPLGQSLYRFKSPTDLIRTKYFHTGGGITIGYFYFWFGLIGVIAISGYLGCIIKKSINSNFDNKNQYFYAYSFFLISTLPRWYLYYPTALFRGTIIFSIFYFILYKFFNIKIKEININKKFIKHE